MIDLREKYKSGYDSRPLSGITHAIFHHADTSIPLTVDQARSQIDAIWSWHTGYNGWPGIGYHFIIDPFGNCYQVNDLSDFSYHVAYNNGYTVGICFLGNYEYTCPSDQAIQAGKELVSYLNGVLGKSLIIAGHAEINPASTLFCPSRVWKNWKGRLMIDNVDELKAQLANQMGINTELQKQVDYVREELAKRDSLIGALKHDVIGKAIELLKPFGI